MKKIKFISLVLALTLALSLFVMSAQASWSTGFPNADRAIELGIVSEDFNPYSTVTVGEFADMLARAYYGNESAASGDIFGANQPAV